MSRLISFAKTGSFLGDLPSPEPKSVRALPIVMPMLSMVLDEAERMVTTAFYRFFFRSAIPCDNIADSPSSKKSGLEVM